MTTITECYIEEYVTDAGKPGARLRQKITGKKVDLGFVTDKERDHFLRFLSAMKQNEATVPDVYSRDGVSDSIEVSGDLDFDAPDEIRYVPNGNLQYLVV